jgi:hypothetical protein
MATMESGLDDARDRSGSTERAFRGYLVAAAAGFAVAATWYTLTSTVETIVGDPNEGNPYLALVFVEAAPPPLVLMLGAMLPLLRAGSRRLKTPASGDGRAPRSIRALSLGFAAAWAFTTCVITFSFYISENGYGLDDGAPLDSANLHAGGWLGAAAVVVSAALTIAALAIAALARPARD